MAVHSYSRCWLHLIWATKERRRILGQGAGPTIAGHLHEYAQEKGIYLKICHVHDDHAHALIDLPEDLAIKEAAKLFKGESSHWINENRVIAMPFHWQTGYGAFSVSQSRLNTVCRYIANQDEHHRRKTFEEEIREFVKAYGLKWREDDQGYEKTVETVQD